MNPALPNSPYVSGFARYSSPLAPASPQGAAETPRLSVAAIEARVRRYNSDIDPGSSTFRVAVMLLTAVEYGQNIDGLTRRTGYDRGFVAKCARRLIDNGVWMAGGTVSDWSPDDEASGAFWNDVAVAEGKLCRRVSADGVIEWAPAGYWNKSYEFVDASSEAHLSTVYRNPAAPARGEPLPAEQGTADPEPAQVPGAALPANSTQPAGQNPTPARPAPPLPAGPGTDPKAVPPRELFPDAVWLR